jgi:hypothetical protein
MFGDEFVSDAPQSREGERRRDPHSREPRRNPAVAELFPKLAFSHAT